MPRKRLQRITAWSYSRYATYVKCPFLAFLKFIKKLKEPQGPALARGSDIHDKAEKYSLSALKKMPQELELFEEEFKALRKIKKKLQTEKQLAVNAKWEPCDWFGNDAWSRCVIDLMYVDGDTLVIVDYKTGKIREEQLEQLEIYVIFGFIFGPEHIKKVRAEFWYLDQGEIRPEKKDDRTWTRAQAEKLKKKWEKNTKQMLADTTFKPTPSADACRWCHFKKSKGGPCQY